MTKRTTGPLPYSSFFLAALVFASLPGELSGSAGAAKRKGQPGLMGRNGDEVREAKLGAWREEICGMTEAGERLEAILGRLEQARLTTTERYILRARAYEAVRREPGAERYQESLGHIDG